MKPALTGINLRAVRDATWIEIGGYWAIQTELMNWIVVREKGDLNSVVGGISRVGPHWYAAFKFHPVYDDEGRYVGDSEVPVVVGWGDDLVGAATGFRKADGDNPFIEGNFADRSL